MRFALLPKAQHFAGNAKLHPAFRAPGMDTRAGGFLVMNIQWGVCASSASTGADETSHTLAVLSLLCAESTTAYSSASI